MNLSKPDIASGSSNLDDQKRLRDLIMRHINVEHIRTPRPETTAVVVLSGPYTVCEKTPGRPQGGTYIVEANLENQSRVLAAVEVLRHLSAQRHDTPLERITMACLRDDAIPLVLNGTEQQLYGMMKFAWQAAFPNDLIHLLDCLPNGIANTSTQFAALSNQQPRCVGTGDLTVLDFSKVCFVTTGYHVVRVAHTAYVQLDQSIDFEVIGTPNGYAGFAYDPSERMSMYHPNSELRRILEYSREDPPQTIRFLPEDKLHVYGL